MTFLSLADTFFQKGQIVIKCRLVLGFRKLWVDSEKIRHYYCVATVSFTNTTFSLWIGRAFSLLRKIYIWFWMENLYWLFFKIHTLWYNDCNWTVPTLQLPYSFTEDILFDTFNWLSFTQMKNMYLTESIHGINISELKKNRIMEMYV